MVKKKQRPNTKASGTFMKKSTIEKVKKLEEELEAEQKKTADYLNRLKYLQADFENYRKRVEKEVQSAIQRSNERLISNIIEVMDDLENAILAGENTENKLALLKGLQIVQKKLDTILENEGLVRLESVGKPFDPNLHEVLSEIPEKGQKTGIIIEETRKGFMFKGKVLRPSVVKIAWNESGEKKNE